MNRHHEEGFTLVELMVALAVLALLATLSLELLRFGMGSWRRVTTQSDNDEKLVDVQSLIRRELNGADPRVIATAAGTRLTFDGNSDSVAFEAPLPLALGAHGTAEIRLGAEPDGDGQNLVMNWRVGGEKSSWRKSVLMPHLKRIAWRYFGRTTERSPSFWQPEWHEKQELPAAIRLDVDFPPGDGRVWPALVVAPAISMDADCLYDAVSQGCRGR